jgi:hypothetical protein
VAVAFGLKVTTNEFSTVHTLQFYGFVCSLSTLLKLSPQKKNFNKFYFLSHPVASAQEEEFSRIDNKFDSSLSQYLV